MKPLERLTGRTIGNGVIALGATACLALSSLSARRAGLLVLAATAVGAASQVSVAAGHNDAAIRPFRVTVPEKELVELRRRIAATRWPTKELVEDRSQGVQLATLKALARYWATEYDWRKAEAKLNALPQFVTTIDGVDDGHRRVGGAVVLGVRTVSGRGQCVRRGSSISQGSRWLHDVPRRDIRRPAELG